MRAPLIAIAAAAAWLAAGPAHAAGNAARGQKLYGECQACHSTQAGATGVGPSLFGMFGRQAGEPDEFRYSPALKRSGITWTPETLDNYLADPQKAVQGNRMPYAGMADPHDRADLIEYLQKTFK
jgi:cytochrome c2